MRKKIDRKTVEKFIEETDGPMNAVAKEDAIVYTDQYGEKHQMTKVQYEKMLRAKKKKIVRSELKQERRVAKTIKRFFDK